MLVGQHYRWPPAPLHSKCYALDSELTEGFDTFNDVRQVCVLPSLISHIHVGDAPAGRLYAAEWRNKPVPQSRWKVVLILAN